MMKLRDLRPGESAIIHSIEDSDLFLKLLEMGCVPGEKIRVEKIAPFGDPISIQVAGYTLSLRLNEADAIFVDPIGESHLTR
jgi:ferrous iron transport protein A